MSGCCPRVTADSALLGCVAPSICGRQLVHTHMSAFIHSCTYMGIVQWSTAPAAGNDGRSCCLLGHVSVLLRPQAMQPLPGERGFGLPDLQ
jgi:hypothetical protein